MSEAKKLCLNTFKCTKFSLFYKKKIFGPKMQITANFDIILKNEVKMIFLSHLNLFRRNFSILAFLNMIFCLNSIAITKKFLWGNFDLKVDELATVLSGIKPSYNPQT